MSFHRVIVAFDGSPRSEDALALALRFTDPHGVLTLACVVTGHRWHLGPQAHRPDAPVPEEIAFMFADVRATTIPRGCTFASAPRSRALLGRVSEVLTEGASYPVLVVPRGAERREAEPVTAEGLEVR